MRPVNPRLPPEYFDPKYDVRRLTIELAWTRSSFRKSNRSNVVASGRTNCLGRWWMSEFFFFWREHHCNLSFCCKCVALERKNSVVQESSYCSTQRGDISTWSKRWSVGNWLLMEYFCNNWEGKTGTPIIPFPSGAVVQIATWKNVPVGFVWEFSNLFSFC